MRIAFLGICAQGHLNPMTALARELQSRGHDVVFISLADAEPFVRAAELTFVPCCEKEFPAGSFNELVRQLSKLQQEEALQFTNQAALAMTEAKLNSLPATLAAAGANAIFLLTPQDYLEQGPVKTGFPYLQFSNAPPFGYTRPEPLCYYDVSH